MRSSLKYFLGAVSIAILVSPLWARTDEMDLTVDHPIMVGTTKLDPGEYQVKADEDKSTVEIIRDGMTVATAPGHWERLAKKADYSEASYNTNALISIQFEGSQESFQVGK